VTHIIVQICLCNQSYYDAQPYRCAGLVVSARRAMLFEEGVQIGEVGSQERKLRLTRKESSCMITFRINQREWMTRGYKSIPDIVGDPSNVLASLASIIVLDFNHGMEL